MKSVTNIWCAKPFVLSLLVGAVCSSTPAFADVDPSQTFPALGAPADPKVDVSWNRFYDVDGLASILTSLEDAYPELCELVEVGTSFEGRTILALEVSNKKTGDPRQKPAMYIDGNIHGNEVQAGEAVAYTAWYLLEMYGEIDRVTSLVDDRTFYLLPTINPDGRDHWFHDPSNPHLFRGGVVPVDNDLDGRFDEDGPDDIDGDGQITSMRVRDSWGRLKPDSRHGDNLLHNVERDERGEYRRLGWEGFDNDGDGRINEDGPGGFDPNRNWPWSWQPEGIQFGAHHYPFSLPNTRAVGDFVKARPNIAGTQSYHNYGGMILRGPGQKSGRLAPEDEALHEFIASRGEEMIPFYDNYVVWDDLYTVWGGEFEWYYGGLGIISFTNELFSTKNYYRRDLAEGKEGRRERLDFVEQLLGNQGRTEWKEVPHPDFGTVEIGGMPKNFGRVPPSFLLEEELHRNMAFTLYHAESMPLLREGETSVESLGGGVYRLRVGVENHGIIPTRTAHDVNESITPRNIVVVSGVSVIASGRVGEPLRDDVQWQGSRPERLLIESFPGLSQTFVEFLVEGPGRASVEVVAERGGRFKTQVEIR